MSSDQELQNARFQFGDSCQRVRAELAQTEDGLRLRMFNEDGLMVAEFRSPAYGLDLAVSLVPLFVNLDYVRMLAGEARAAA